MTPSDFLDLIHGPNAPIYFGVGGKTWRNKPQTYAVAEPKLRWRNGLGDDVCFVVNSGGTRDNQISRVNAVFTDWDAGRDEHGTYFAPEIVRLKKQSFRQRLTVFPVEPSIIVETRNGFHAYWLLEAGVTCDDFRACQLRLAEYFEGDRAVCNPARLMRLPGFDWVKPGSGCEPFRVEIIGGNAVRYPLESLLRVLPPLKENAVASSVGAICAHNKCSGVNTRALIVGLDPPLAPRIVSSYSDALSLIKQENLGRFLGVGEVSPDHPTTIRCPYHDDKHPSASITRSARTGYWRFKCHSTRCGIAGSIIDLAMQRPESPTWTSAIQYLLSTFNITVSTPWRDGQHAILEHNLSLLKDTELLSQYPALNRLVRRILPDLRMKLNIARSHLVSNRLARGENAIFFCSLRQFHRATSHRSESPRYFNRQNQKVDRYCLLGLMHKVADRDIPPAFLANAQEEQRARGFSHRVQFYSIPAYTPEVMTVAESRALVLLAAGASVRGISKVLVYDLFGQDLAQQIYPQTEKYSASASTSILSAAVEGIVDRHISERGYSRLSDIRQEMVGCDQWPSITERRIERVLPGIMRRKKVTKTVCNKRMKDILGIDSTGYPRIIVPLSLTANSGPQ